MKVAHVWSTPQGESLIAHCARVSSPKPKEEWGSDYEGLLKYCVKNHHWSVFEMASMCVEIETSRAISAQILRHKSFSFQEFSQRYAVVTEFESYEARRQADKNRQSSVDDMDSGTKEWFRQTQEMIQQDAQNLYDIALSKGIAKEQARFLLPMGARTTVFMSGSMRSWYHYIQLRSEPNTQKEHRDIALAIRGILTQNYPTIGKMLHD